MNTKRFLVVMATLAMVMALVCACSKEDDGSTDTIQAESTQETVNETENDDPYFYGGKHHFIRLDEYKTFVSSLELAPDFEKEGALESLKKGTPFPDKETGKYYIGENNYFLLDDTDNSLRYVSPSKSSDKLIEVKLFKSENDKLVVVGIRAYDECRVPVVLTIMEDGNVLNSTVYSDINVDTLGLEGYEKIFSSQFMTLVQKDNFVWFYRYGEPISDKYEMPKKVDGDYSQCFLSEDGILYLTIMSTSISDPWIKMFVLDKDVTGFYNYTKVDDYSTAIYEKTVEKETRYFYSTIDKETYDNYVYVMYPSIVDKNVIPQNITNITEVNPEDDNKGDDTKEV